MEAALMSENPCKKGGSNCGQCVRVLGVCDPSPAPVAVDAECMKSCLKETENTCVACVNIYAKCMFGRGSMPDPDVKSNDGVFEAAEEVLQKQLSEQETAPALPVKTEEKKKDAGVE